MNAISNQASSASDYQFKIDGRPEFSFLTVNLPAGKTLKVEAAGMATMDSNIKMKTKLKGGFARFLGGESLFVNEFTAQGGAGQIQIAPASPGDLEHVYLDNQTIFLQSGSFVAASPSITLETKWQGLKRGFFSGERFFLIKCSGKGDLWFNSFGAIEKVETSETSLPASGISVDNLVIDTGHIVAFTGGLTYDVRSVGGYKSLFFSGEGLVCHFSGTGTVWMQTRKPNRFLSWLYYFRPIKSKE